LPGWFIKSAKETTGYEWIIDATTAVKIGLQINQEKFSIKQPK
jgi:hypothetical protein